MPNKPLLVINTSPLIALATALDHFQVLGEVADLVVPGEVLAELEAGAIRDQTVSLVRASSCCVLRSSLAALPPVLTSTLGPGESAVIHTALTDGIETAVIDERKGRRWAALHGLRVTGSLGLLLALRRRKLIPPLLGAMERLAAKGIHLEQALVRSVLEEEAKL